jgi:hypothetical protein
MNENLEEMLKLPPKEANCELFKHKALLELNKNLFAVSRYYGDPEAEKFLVEIAMAMLINLIGAKQMQNKDFDANHVFDALKQSILFESELAVKQKKAEGKTTWRH